MQILREISITPIDRGNLRSAVVLEQLPHRFFPGWGTAILITIATLIPLWFYYYLYLFWYKQEQSHGEDLPLYIGNRIIGWFVTMRYTWMCIVSHSWSRRSETYAETLPYT